MSDCFECVHIDLRPAQSGGLVTGSLRQVATPFVAAAPGGARVRARLRMSAGDEAVLRAVGAHLGSLAGSDLAARCAEGRLDARGRARSRAARKRALTAESSSRWAGAITRTSEDQVRLAGQNLRAAQRSLQAAKARGARAIVIEDLDFAEARAEGRERAGSRPRRGRRGRDFRRAVAGIPTGKLRDRVVQMAANAGLQVIVVDAAYTSRWGAEHWLRPLREHHPQATGHHAAALVIGRRGLGHRARRRATGTRTAPEDAARPAQARPRTTPAHRTAPRKPATPPGPRQPPGTQTGQPHRTTAGNQAAHDRSGPPPRQDHVLLAQQERFGLW
jgi:hypothetical protein